MMISAVIVDDEPYARKGIRHLLAGEQDVTVVGEAGNGRAAVALIGRTAPDLIFLDVQMPDMNGFEVLARLDRREPPVIIFITAFEEYAIRAFEACALDYLLKPTDIKRFQTALQTARKELDRRNRADFGERLLALVEHYRSVLEPAAAGGGMPASATGLRLKTKEGETFLSGASIDWIEAQDYYCCVHSGERSYLLRRSIGSLERELSSNSLVRIHRSTLVNTRFVARLERPHTGGRVAILRDGASRSVSRSGWRRLNRVLPPIS